MKEFHHFYQDENTDDYFCTQCGFHWLDIYTFIITENKNSDIPDYSVVENDDCNVRIRMRKLKAFW